MNRARQDADALDDMEIIISILIFIVEFGPNLKAEEAGEEEGAAEVVDEFPDLVSADRDEAFVAAVLAVFLFEDDAGEAAGLALLGGDVFAGVRAGDGEDGFVVFWIGAGKAGEVGEGFGLGRVEDGGSGGGVGEVAAEGGECGEEVTREKHGVLEKKG